MLSFSLWSPPRHRCQRYRNNVVGASCCLDAVRIELQALSSDKHDACILYIIIKASQAFLRQLRRTGIRKASEVQSTTAANQSTNTMVVIWRRPARYNFLVNQFGLSAPSHHLRDVFFLPIAIGLPWFSSAIDY